MDAQDLMTDTVYVVSPSDSVAHVRRLLVQHKVSLIPVVDGGEVVGLVGERDLSDAFYHLREPIDAVNVSEVMNKNIAIVDPSATPEKIAKLLTSRNTGAAAVFDQETGGVMGLVTKTDVTKYFSQNCYGRTTVSELMQDKVQTIGRFHSVFRAAREMEENDIGRLVVMEEGVVGILTARDLALATYGLRPEKLVFLSEKKQRKVVHFRPLIVDDLMSQEVFTIPSKSDAVSAAKLMLEKKIGSVVVVDNNKLMGIITKTDIVRYLASC